MAETPPPPQPTPSPQSDTDTLQYWCHQCEKRVSIETVTDLPDIICFECKNGFVELIPVPPPSPPPPSTNPVPSFSSQFLQILRLIAEAARDDENPPPPPPTLPSADSPDSGDFLRIELNGWGTNNNNNDDDDDDDDDDEEGDEIDFGNTEGGGDPSEIGNENEEEEEEEEQEEEEEEDNIRRRRRRDLLRLRIRDFATRATSGRNRILDWSEILMGLEDHTMQFRVEIPEWDGYVGNPEDYVDAAGYEQLLQNLAELDGARKGAPPASKSVVSELKNVVIAFEEEGLMCAICKEGVPVGEKAKKMPCGHGYHGDCIDTWLGSRNTCPVCRFELPTDDPEYEEQRKKRSSSSSSAVGGSSNS